MFNDTAHTKGIGT